MEQTATAKRERVQPRRVDKENTAAQQGKVGLALSGGGFRASLFHVGVLARLAEVGLLRRVEVISTVSGGSIVGALYYLHVKELLESKPDHDVTDEDYVKVVAAVEEGLLYGVQQNLRMRTFASLSKNWKMRRPDYTRSHRMGELYHRYFYRHVYRDGAREAVPMRELKIIPAGEADDFHPRRDNARRFAKVPILLINATSLNTGRNWRFEATQMGEPPRLSRQAVEVDKLPRLVRAPGYDDLPDHLRNMPLGTAVAASTAVPGLFHPLAISDMYPGRRIELVDGGVHDNQGVQGLLDEECEHLIISDASGPMDEDPNPGTSAAMVLLRTNSVMMNRLREEQLFGITAGARARSVALIHLQQGLPVEQTQWIGAETSPPAPAAPPGPKSRIDARVQRLLARVRTDLDSFTEVEAFSLMYLGYDLTRQALQRTPSVTQFARRGQRSDWRFLAVRPWMERPTPEYLKQLEVARGTVFKAIRLVPWLAPALAGLAVAAAAALVAFGWDWLVRPRALQLTWAWWQLGVVGAALLSLPWTGRILVWRRTLGWARRPLSWMYRLLFQAVLPIGAALFIRLYLVTVDPLFLRQGRLDRLTPPPEEEPARTRRAWWGRLGRRRRRPGKMAG